MKAIIITIKEQREELISEYNVLAKAYNQLGDQIDKLIFGLCKGDNSNDEQAESIMHEREEIKVKAGEIRAAINELGNALGHLGYKVEPFFG